MQLDKAGQPEGKAVRQPMLFVAGSSVSTGGASAQALGERCIEPVVRRVLAPLVLLRLASLVLPVQHRGLPRRPRKLA